MGTKNIKKDTSLRKAILQAAITGQLEISNVQCAISETGEQLLDRIIAERNAKALAEWGEKVKVNAKAKKPAPIVASEIDADEIPFEIPESWCWCRIDDLFAHNSGKALNKSENKEGTELEYITTSNLYWNYFDLDNLRTMLFKDSEIEKCTVRKGDLLVCEGGEVGRTAIWNFDRTICIQNHIHRLRAYEASLNIKFYYYVLFLYKEGKIIDNYAKGIGIKGLSSNALGSIVIPLPPLAEQNAIVAKLEEVLPLVEIYENAVLQKEELKSTLSDKVKKAILQAAITGQLGISNAQLGIGNVQCAISETGKELLQRIIAERNAQALAEWGEKVKVNAKAKKPVPIVASEIDADDVPFEIPENWCWVRGKNIFAPMESTKPCGESFIYIDTDAVNNKLNIIDNPKNLLVKEAPSRATRKLHKGDVLFSMVRPYLKNIAFVADEFADAIASTGFYVMTQIGMYNPKYLYYMVLSPYVIDGLHKFMKGDNSPSINTTDIDNFLFPLPPLAVQNAIVAKLEQVLPLCEHIAVSNEK